MLSMELLSSVHGSGHVSVDLMEQCLIGEVKQPTVNELQVQLDSITLFLFAHQTVVLFSS